MNRIVIIWLGLIGISLIISYKFNRKSDSSSQFLNWKKEFKIQYRSLFEEAYRYQIFMSNRRKIEQHNSQPNTYRLGFNKYSDLTLEQFQSMFLQNYQQASYSKIQEKVQVKLDIDWAQKGAVSPVKNSGSCAASYASSSVGSLQSLRKIKDGFLKKLSEQEIIDCSFKYGNNGCSSGLPVNTFKYVIDNGISDQSQYPYTGTSKSCQTQYSTFKISKYIEIKSCESLQNSLINQPIAVLVDASNWMFYASGIFNKCTVNTINLAVLLTGMTDTYWKLKNQWGTSWGQQGYIRLSMGNCCGICQMGSAPLK